MATYVELKEKAEDLMRQAEAARKKPLKDRHLNLPFFLQTAILSLHNLK